MEKHIALCLAVGGVVLSLGGTSAMALSYSDTVLADNPTAYFRFEETSGTTAANSAAGHSGDTLTYQSATKSILGQTGAFAGSGNLRDGICALCATADGAKRQVLRL